MVESTEMFHDWNTGLEQDGVSRPDWVGHIIDIGAVNPNQGNPSLHQEMARIGS